MLNISYSKCQKCLLIATELVFVFQQNSAGCRHRFGSQPGYGKYKNQAEEEAQSTIQKAKGHC